MTARVCPAPKLKDGKVQRCGRQLLGEKERICPSCAAALTKGARDVAKVGAAVVSLAVIARKLLGRTKD